jgi:hypothetical protein
MSLENLSVSKSEAHEPKEEEYGKTKIMEWIASCSAGEVLKRNSGNFLREWE